MIKITRSISLSDNEIKFDFIRSSGPGGQNVNKRDTKVAAGIPLTSINILTVSLYNIAKGVDTD